MKHEELLALIDVLIEERIKEIPVVSGKRGVRGPKGERGLDGKDGESFTWEKFEIQILQQIKEHAIKGERGERGYRGAKGIDGKDGKDGRDGIDGKDFIWDDHKEKILDAIRSHKLRFDDLTDEQKLELKGERGARGQRGKQGLQGERGEKGDDGQDGKSFEWSEHEEKIFSEIEKHKLTFEKLSDEERESLRGHRGARGQRGKQGPQGEQGPRGLTGIQGLSGLDGKDGKDGKDGLDGRDGLDAPIIIDIKLIEWNESFYFKFFFDDGTAIETKKIEKPRITELIQNVVAGGGGGHRSYQSTGLEYDVNNRVVVARDYIDNNKQFLGRKEEIFYSGNFVDYIIESLWSAEGIDENAPNKLIVEKKIDIMYSGNFVTDIKVSDV